MLHGFCDQSSVVCLLDRFSNSSLLDIQPLSLCKSGQLLLLGSQFSGSLVGTQLFDLSLEGSQLVDLRFQFGDSGVSLVQQVFLL